MIENQYTPFQRPQVSALIANAVALMNYTWLHPRGILFQPKNSLYSWWIKEVEMRFAERLLGTKAAHMFQYSTAHARCASGGAHRRALPYGSRSAPPASLRWGGFRWGALGTLAQLRLRGWIKYFKYLKSFNLPLDTKQILYKYTLSISSNN